ncbi:MAG: FeoA family protein [Desulfovibrionaceae bacterium]
MPGWIRKTRPAQSRSPEHPRSVDAQTANAPHGGGGYPRLTDLTPGQEAEVAGVDAGRKARCRLASLGLIPGSRLRVVASARFGPMLLSLGETRLMLERGVAAKVLVSRAA